MPRPPLPTLLRQLHRFAPLRTLLLLLLIATTATASPLQRPNALHIRLYEFPAHLNPLLQAGEVHYTLSAQLFAAPLRFDAEGEAIPYLAKWWQLSEDGREIRLQLLEGARFHDGEPITSADLAFSLLALRDHNPNWQLFAAIDRVETPDPHSAIIHLRHRHPAPELLLTAPLAPVLPRHIYGDGQPLRNHLANHQPVGSGPFRWTPARLPGRIELVRNEDFFRPGLPHLERVIFLREDRDSPSQLLLQHDELQLLPYTYAGSPGFAQLRENPELRILQADPQEWSLTSSLVLNLDRPPLSDLRVRQALASGIDMERILGLISQGQDRWNRHPIPSTSPLYTPLPTPFHYDPERANALLDEAGYPRDANGIRFRLTLDTAPFGTNTKVMETLRFEYRRNLGVAVDLHHSSHFVEWATRLVRREFEMTFWLIFSFRDPLLSFHRIFHSRRPEESEIFVNQSGYHHPQIDRLLAAAAEESEPEARRHLYAEVQQEIFTLLPMIPMSLVDLHHVYRKGLIGPELSSWGTTAPYDEWRWRERE